MARRYLSVNISQEQQEFMRLLDNYEIEIFSIEAISRQIEKDLLRIAGSAGRKITVTSTTVLYCSPRFF